MSEPYYSKKRSKKPEEQEAAPEYQSGPTMVSPYLSSQLPGMPQNGGYGGQMTAGRKLQAGEYVDSMGRVQVQKDANGVAHPGETSKQMNENMRANAGQTYVNNPVSNGTVYMSSGKATMGDQREPESNIKRAENGDRTATDKRTGEKRQVGDRINARVGAKRDADAEPLSSYTPSNNYSTKPGSVNDESFQHKGNAVYDAKQAATAKEFEAKRVAKTLPKEEQITADSWAEYDAKNAPAKQPAASVVAGTNYDPATLAKVRSAGKTARAEESARTISEGKAAFDRWEQSTFAQNVKKRKKKQQY